MEASVPIIAIDAAGSVDGASFQSQPEREPEALTFDPMLSAERFAAYYHTCMPSASVRGLRKMTLKPPETQKFGFLPDGGLTRAQAL